MALARELKVTPTRITQILNLLKLAPPIQGYILGMVAVRGREGLAEKHVRTLCRLSNPKLQLEVFGHLAARLGKGAPNGAVSTPPVEPVAATSGVGRASGPEEAR